MSGRARLALCAWAATMLAACALLPLVEDVSWLLQVVFLLGVQTLVFGLIPLRFLDGHVLREWKVVASVGAMR